MSEVVNGVVYLLTCKVTGLQCVGKSWNYENRMCSYRGYERSGGHGEIGKAIREHGWDNFTHVKIAQGIQTESALSKTEDAFIELLKTRWPHGYNLRAGGGHGRHNAATKAKISQIMRGRPSPHLGRKHSLETRKKQSESMRGKKRPPRSAEHCAKLSASVKAAHARKRMNKSA